MRSILLIGSIGLLMAACSTPTPPATSTASAPADVVHHAPLTGSHIRSTGDSQAAQPGLNSVSGSDFNASRVGNTAAQGTPGGGQ